METALTLDELRAIKRDAILAIAARHGVSGIRVFGSFARGEARNDSANRDRDRLQIDFKSHDRLLLSFLRELAVR
jgi:predicted nucleotidyltransferase